MVARYITPVETYLDSNGDPLSGGLLYFYATGTTTPQDTFTDEELTPGNENANPVVLDSAGRTAVDIWLSNASYKVVLKDSAAATIWTRDPVSNPELAGTIAESFVLSGILSPAQITADQNDYDPTGLANAAVLRLSTDASRNLTGLAGGATGRVIVIENIGSNALVLKDDSSSSIAANRIALSADLTLRGDQSVILQYDGTSARWRAHGQQLARLPGLDTIWIPAIAMVSRTTNGAAGTSSESTTNKVMTRSLDFDQTTQEFAQFAVRFPKSWDEGTVTFAPIWTAASGSGGVVFGLAGAALSDDDALDTAYGTAVTSTDTLITANDVHVGPTSAAITIAGTPAVGDWVTFQVNRTVADGSDTLNADARLLGVALFFTTNAADDT